MDEETMIKEMMEKEIREEMPRKPKKVHYLWRQFCIFLLTFFLIIGLVTVDKACSRMYGGNQMLSLHLERIDDAHIGIEFFGRSTSIDTIAVEKQLYAVKENWNNIFAK